jgi:hypothetical protein
MTRSIQIQLGTETGDWFRTALESLANDVLSDAEAGQRRAKLSRMIQMIATAYIGNATETTRLMLRIKTVALEPEREPPPAPS